MIVVFIYIVDVFFFKSSISIYCNFSFFRGVFYIVYVIIFFRGGGVCREFDFWFKKDICVYFIDNLYLSILLSKIEFCIFVNLIFCFKYIVNKLFKIIFFL